MLRLPTPPTVRLLAAALVALASPAALAQTCTTSWTNPGGGAWETAGNWSDGIPGPADTVCITLDGTYTVSTSTANRMVAGLVVGGAVGVQTLAIRNRFTVSGDGRVGPAGRLELLLGATFDGLLVGGTLLVEGVLVQNAGTTLLDGGGLVDVAPGGRWEMTGGAIGGVAARPGAYRLRGLLVASHAGAQRIGIPLDVDGGAIEVQAGEMHVESRGTLRNATFDVAGGALLMFTRANGFSGDYLVEGTMRGDVQGTLRFSATQLRAGPAGATLDVGGTGILSQTGSSPLTVTYASAGGSFLNTGRMRFLANNNAFRQVVFRNEGLMQVDASNILLYDGAVVRNEPSGTFELLDGGTVGGFSQDGRIENFGLVVARRDDLVGGLPQSRFNGTLRSLPGSELRVLGDAAVRLELDGPGSQSFPGGVRLTGTATARFPLDLEPAGEISPGTDAEPLTRLDIMTSYRPTSSHILVVDVGAGGASDTLAVGFAPGGVNTRLGGTLIVRVRPGVTPQIGDTWTVLTSEGPGGITEQFAQVVAQDAPDGLAFVAERSPDGRALVVRAVEVAPGGPFVVSTTTPVGGGFRTLFLTGPGVVGITAVRVECVDCLDESLFPRVLGRLSGTGTLREARFDLTHPRIFGVYDLVVERAGQPLERVPLTIRPYISSIRLSVPSQTGMRARPAGAGQDHNFSVHRLQNVTNASGSAFPFAKVARPAPDRVSMLLTSRHSVPGAVYVSATADAPLEPPLVQTRVRAATSTDFEVGLRVDPSDVLFPEQTPTGPDDDRLPFGQGQTLAVFTTANTSFEKAAFTTQQGLRNASFAFAPLEAYLDAVDAVDSTAVTRAVWDAIQPGPSALNSTRSVLALVLDGLRSFVPTPVGLAEAAHPVFADSLDTAIGDLVRREYAAHTDALSSGSPLVRGLLEAELAALGIEYDLTITPDGPAAAPPGPAARRRLGVFGTGGTYQDTPSGGTNYTGTIPTGPFGGGLGGGYANPSGNAGLENPAPSGPVDPNDKTAASDLTCEFGTVLVDGEPETRCVRYFVPRSRAEDPIVYTVLFENLPAATAPAEFVTITDEIDPHLNLASLDVLATSSDSTFSYSVAGRTVTFRFVGIDLPPNTDPPRGEGFVQFALRPTAALPDSTEIRNRASIVFDFNPPIVTPDVVHQVRETADMAAVVEAPAAAAVGQPATFRVLAANLRGDDALGATVTITSGAPVLSATTALGTCEGTAPVVCALGDLGPAEGSPPNAPVEIEVVVQPASAGDLVVSARASSSVFDGFAANDTDAAQVVVKSVAGEDAPGSLAELTLLAPSPNPVRGATTLRWGLPADGAVDLRVYDLLGREVSRLIIDGVAPAGWHETRWEATVASGVYVVRLLAGRDVRTQRLVVVR